jgi:hypothetical protein
MPTFAHLQAEAPAIAEFLGPRIAKTGLCLLGTTRQDGWPRVSPIELTVVAGRVYVGSMPQGVKAKDLQRDPRCCILTPLADKDDLAGEAKAFCTAREVTEPEEWEQVRAAFREANGVDVGDPGGAHIFELSIEAAAWQRVEGDDWRTTSWQAGAGVRERVRNGPTGASHDVGT